ncbi:MAG: PKD domain-containing protein [Bacteroidia bacterium]|nr:PKD domain-containing protein [Bacteroidia bacterium]
MCKRTLIFLILVISQYYSYSQITLSAGADTTICLGTSATLNAQVPSFTFHQTTSYVISYPIPFTPEPYTGTNAGISIDDQCYGPFPIGFTFCFYGNSYTNFFLGSNGWIGFNGAPGNPGGTGYDPWPNTSIPNATTSAPHDCIMGPWKDWYPAVGPSPGNYVRYTTTGTAPNRKLIVTYQNVPMYSCTSVYATFQMVLHETSNIIDNYLVHVTVCPGWNSGNGTEGLQNLNGTQATPVPGRNGTQWTADNNTVEFQPNGPLITNSVTWYALPNTTTPIGTGNSITVTPTVTTTYRAKLTVCTTLTDDVVVTVNPCGHLEGTTTNVDCYGASTGSATVYIYNGVPPYTYSWSNGTVLAGSTATSSTISNLAAGTYSVTVSMFSGAYSLDTTFIITQNAQMALDSISSTPEACASANNGTLTVGITNGTPTYFFNCGPVSGYTNNDSFQFTGLDAGSYLVTVTDNYGCTVMNTYIVNTLPQMTISLSPVSATCPGAPDGSIHVHVTNGTPDYTYFCSFSPQQPTIAQNNYIFTGLQGGNYNIQVIDANGCVATGVTVVGQLQLSSSFNVSNVTCYAGHNGSASVQIGGGTQPYDYLWSTGATSSSINLLYSGYYACTVTDSHNCVIVVPLTVAQPDSIVISSSQDTTMCLTQTATLSANATGGTTPYSFVWSNNQTAQSIQVSPTNTSTYTVHVVDHNGCLSILADVTVNIFPHVDIYLSTNVDSICAGDSTAIMANFGGGNGGPYNCFYNDSMVNLPFYVHPNVTTTYTLTGKDTCGSPSGSSSIIIHVLNAPGTDLQALPTSGCAPVSVTFIDPTPYNGQLYNWTFEDVGGDGYSVARKPVYTYNNPGIFDVIITTKSTFGCYSTVIYNDFIEIKPSPTAGFVAEPTAASIFNPTIYFHNTTPDFVSDTWSLGDGTSSYLTDVQHVYGDTGTFPVQLIVQNSAGCTDTMLSYIQITPENTFWAPNAFNPKSDHSENTSFRPVGFNIDPQNYHLIVYDRWGGIAFETYDINHSWDGRLNNGDYAKSGTYPWVVIYKDVSGKTYQKSGAVSLIE